MAYYIARRIAAIGLILVVISILIFAITQALPGNVAHMIAGQFATPDVIAAIEAKLGLHDPLVVQYWRWATRILSGDLGQSLIMERPIGPMLRHALANSAILAAVSFAVVAIAGVSLELSPHFSMTPRSITALRSLRSSASRFRISSGASCSSSCSPATSIGCPRVAR